MPTKKQLQAFITKIKHYYVLNRRSFAWRENPTPYYVVVSEIMLQQTQTDRVSPKFVRFIEELPTFEALANAPERQVLTLWQGLGYNRRALSLQNTAQRIVHECNGILPHDPEVLVTFKGIGPATAASICAFAHNTPTCFIETNIRAVYIHEFFKDQQKVDDKELMPLVQATVDHTNPRDWYYALMDYGVMLKKTLPNPSRLSKHHTKQSKFEGSERQIRGMIIKALTENHRLTLPEMLLLITKEEQRVINNLSNLCKEALVKTTNDYFHL